MERRRRERCRCFTQYDEFLYRCAALSAAGADPPRFACFAFNRRGHDILSIRDSRAAEGAAFQLTDEGIADNRYAAAWLAEQGFPNPIAIGHSNGGMLVVKHASDKPGTPAMVLLSAHGGGRDGLRRTSRAGLLAGDRLEEITARARSLAAAGRGRELMLVPG